MFREEQTIQEIKTTQLWKNICFYSSRIYCCCLTPLEQTYDQAIRVVTLPIIKYVLLFRRNVLGAGCLVFQYVSVLLLAQFEIFYLFETQKHVLWIIKLVRHQFRYSTSAVFFSKWNASCKLNVNSNESYFLIIFGFLYLK